MIPNDVYKDLMALSKSMREDIKEEIQKFEKFLIKFFEDKLKSTLKNPSFNNPQGRLPGFHNAVPKVKTRIIREKAGAYKLSVFAFMSTSGTDAPHFVWHVINRGRKRYTAKRMQIFPIRVNARTVPNSFKVGKFPGWSGKWVAIPKGGIVEGIEARKFYDAIVKDLRTQISTKFPEYEETKMDIKN